VTSGQWLENPQINFVLEIQDVTFDRVMITQLFHKTLLVLDA